MLSDLSRRHSDRFGPLRTLSHNDTDVAIRFLQGIKQKKLR